MGGPRERYKIAESHIIRGKNSLILGATLGLENDSLYVAEAIFVQ